jgi:transcriptional regulator with XRE-family HTH domain
MSTRSEASVKKITNLQRARLERGFRQKELSKRTGIRQPLLSDFETGKLIPGEAMRAKLAKVLHVSESWLFPGLQ